MRNRRACLQTDIRDLLKQIEKGLHTLHALYKEIGDTEEPILSEKNPILESVPDADKVSSKGVWVSDVLVDSPAATAGFQIGD